MRFRLFRHLEDRIIKIELPKVIQLIQTQQAVEPIIGDHRPIERCSQVDRMVFTTL